MEHIAVGFQGCLIDGNPYVAREHLPGMVGLVVRSVGFRRGRSYIGFSVGPVE